MSRSNKVLIFKLAGLGDILMATPCIRAYKKSFPDVKLAFMVGKSNVGVIKNNQYIDEIIEIDDKAIFKGSIKAKISEIVRILQTVRKLKPEKVFILHKDWRYNFIFWLSGIKTRIGYSRDLRGFFLTEGIETNREEHEIEKYYKLFTNQDKYKKDGNQMDLFPTIEDQEKVSDFIKEIPLSNGRKLAFAVGGALNVKEEMDIRRWKTEYFVEVIKKRLEIGDNIFLVGANSDKIFNEKIIKELKKYENKGLFDTAGLFTIGGTKYLLEKMDLMITHDCGPMHIAASAEIPVIAIFGPTYPIEKVPITNLKSTYLWKGNKIDCSPCYYEGNFAECKRDNICMKEILPKEVFEKLEEILNT